MKPKVTAEEIRQLIDTYPSDDYSLEAWEFFDARSYCALACNKGAVMAAEIHKLREVIELVLADYSSECDEVGEFVNTVGMDLLRGALAENASSK